MNKKSYLFVLLELEWGTVCKIFVDFLVFSTSNHTVLIGSSLRD